MNEVNFSSNNLDLKKRIQFKQEKEDKKILLATKLMNKELSVSDLTDIETADMIEWFKRDIEEKNIKLNRIKKHILEIRKEIRNI